MKGLTPICATLVGMEWLYIAAILVVFVVVFALTATRRDR